MNANVAQDFLGKKVCINQNLRGDELEIELLATTPALHSTALVRLRSQFTISFRLSFV
jgi:hypothetical protein